MGWKTTETISRSDAKELIIKRLVSIDSLDNGELADLVEGCGYGDIPSLEHFGCNFIVVDDDQLINDIVI